MDHFKLLGWYLFYLVAYAVFALGLELAIFGGFEPHPWDNFVCFCISAAAMITARKAAEED